MRHTKDHGRLPFKVIAGLRRQAGVGTHAADEADCPQVAELAERLLEAAVLAAYVNSNDCSDEDRGRLRDLVPAAAYLQLLCNLADLRSQLARRIRQTTGRSHQIIVDVGSFFDDYERTPYA